jgi:hypothetical protein
MSSELSHNHSSSSEGVQLPDSDFSQRSAIGTLLTLFGIDAARFTAVFTALRQ